MENTATINCSPFHVQLKEAMESRDAISLMWWEEDYYQAIHYGFITKYNALQALCSNMAEKEYLTHFILDVLPNDAFSNAEHEFWGSKGALELAEIMDAKLDSYSPIGWYFGTFNREGAVDGRALGWCKCGKFCVKDWNLAEVCGSDCIEIDME